MIFNTRFVASSVDRLLRRGGVNSTSESLSSEASVLPDVEGVFAIMDHNIVLVGFKAGHPPAFLKGSSDAKFTFQVVFT